MITRLMYLDESTGQLPAGRDPAAAPKTAGKATIRERVIYALHHGADVPALPVTVLCLLDVVRKRNVDLEMIAEIARLDPGITARIFAIASTATFGGDKITRLEDALLLLGTDEIKRIATTFSVINIFRHLRVKVNWELFWLHSLFTARLTEKLAGAYRDVDGREYLAGLLHDVGKLFLEHHFLREFDQVIASAVSGGDNMYEAENRLLDITHAEVSARLCHKWHLHHEVVGAIQFHHEPNSPLNRDPNDPSYTPLLALCVCIADKVANQCHANIQGAENLDNVALNTIPEWKSLQKYAAVRALSLDVAGELEKAEQIIGTVKTSAGSRLHHVGR